MAQDTSIEAARARIQRLVEEIAQLSKQEMRSEEFFQQFIVRAVQATDAKGGAVWLVAPRANDGKSEFQLVGQVEMESSGFRASEAQHKFLLRVLTETAQTRKPSAIAPEPAPPDPGSLQAQMAQMQAPAAGTGNQSPYPFFHIPLVLKEQVLGVLQVWLQPYVVPANFQEFITFLTSLAAHVEQHLHSRRLGSLVLENQRLQQVLKFSSDLAGSLDPLEVARLAANYGRDLIGCERCSVLSLRGDHWKVVAISGQEVVEKKSSMVKAMVAFIAAHAQPEAFRKHHPDPAGGAPVLRHELLLLSKKELLARAEAPHEGVLAGEPASLTPALRRTDEIDLAYFDHSHVVSAAIAPMFDAEQELVGAFFAESTAEGFFDSPGAGKEPSSSQRMTEWIALHTGKSLQAAQDYRTLPLLFVSRRIRDTYHAYTGHRRRRSMLKLGIALGVLFLIGICPTMEMVDGNCSIIPLKRAAVVPEVPGRVEKILVHEGSHVAKGEPIAQLDTTRLEIELEGARQEQFRARAEADRLRGMGDEAQAQVATLQAVIAQKSEEKLKTDVAGATLRSPIDGVVLTKDLELHAGEFIQPGTPFAEIANLEEWEVQVEVNERAIGRVEAELAKGRALIVNYILYSQSAHKLEGELKDLRQVSAMAYPREKENVFIITLPSVQAPPEMRKDLRPGLTGRAKIALHRAPLLWWALQSLTNWLRLKII